MGTLTCIAAVGALLSAAQPAEGQAATETHHHRYRLAQIDTFGGPNVELAVEPIAQIVNVGAQRWEKQIAQLPTPTIQTVTHLLAEVPRLGMHFPGSTAFLRT